MTTFVPSRPRPGLVRRLGHRLQAAVPLLVWLAALAGVLVLTGQGNRRWQAQGIVEAAQAAVRMPGPGMLTVVSATLHTSVHKGQVLVRLDDADLRQRLALARTTLERLRAELDLQQAERQHERSLESVEARREHAIEQRRLSDSDEETRIAALATRAELEEARVRLRGTAIELERLQVLGNQGLVADTQLVRARTEQEALQQRITELEGVQKAQHGRVEAIGQRRDRFAMEAVADLPEATALAPFRWRLREQETELERVTQAAANLDLLAPVDGVVQAVHAQAGEWLPAGAVVVEIVEQVPRHIRVFVPPPLRDRVRLAAAVTVEPVARRGTAYHALALSVSPAPVRVPELLWRIPRQEEWAFELLLQAGGNEFAGERVQVRFSP